MNQRRQDFCKKMDRTYIQKSVGLIKHFNFLLQRRQKNNCRVRDAVKTIRQVQFIQLMARVLILALTKSFIYIYNAQPNMILCS
jgi:hypothetical protein